MKETERLMVEIMLVKKILLALQKNSIVLGGWISKNSVLRFFDYSDSQLRSLERTNSIVVSKIGRRKFYSVDSIVAFIDNNKKL